MAASAKLMTMAGPVCSPATMPVTENRPAPIITPTPRAIKPQGPNTRFNPLPPSLSASCSKSSALFFTNKSIAMYLCVCILCCKVSKMFAYHVYYSSFCKRKHAQGAVLK